eukprot:4781049-Pleurochrysis_carterae.AAC.5
MARSVDGGREEVIQSVLLLQLRACDRRARCLRECNFRMARRTLSRLLSPTGTTRQWIAFARESRRFASGVPMHVAAYALVSSDLRASTSPQPCACISAE